MIGHVLDGRAQAMLVELVQQQRQRRAFHFLLVKRLHGSEAGSGASLGAVVHESVS